MKFKSSVLIVNDIDKAKEFYCTVLHLHVIMDLGENVTLTGGIALQSKESWVEFTHTTITWGRNDTELYFEEDDFDSFVENLSHIPNLSYVHPVMEHRWGQRVIRFYDLDHHMIEVGENLKVVCRRFLESGMTEEEVANRMEVPLKFVLSCKKV